MYFEYKTYQDQVFKIKQTEQGLEKILEKPDTFNPPPNDNFERVVKVRWYIKTNKWILFEYYYYKKLKNIYFILKYICVIKSPILLHMRAITLSTTLFYLIWNTEKTFQVQVKLY